MEVRIVGYDIEETRNSLCLSARDIFPTFQDKMNVQIRDIHHSGTISRARVPELFG